MAVEGDCRSKGLGIVNHSCCTLRMRIGRKPSESLGSSHDDPCDMRCGCSQKPKRLKVKQIA
eukprot:4199199-Amphidinium_carterae.1